MKDDFINKIIYGGIDHDMDGDVDINDAFIGDEIRKSTGGSHKHHEQFDEYDIAEMDEFERELNGIDDEEYKWCREFAGYVDEEEDVEEDEDYEEDEDFSEEEDEPLITLTFNVESSEDNKRTDGVYKYLEYGRWDYFRAVYDHFPELKEDYAGDEDLDIATFITEMAEVNIERAVKYWKWVMDTFTAEIINSAKKEPENEYDYEPAGRILYLMVAEYPTKEVMDIIRDDKYFKYIFIDMDWEKHGTTTMGNTLSNVYLYDSFDLMKKCYEAFIKYQKDKYTNRDLKEIWDTFLVFFEWKEDGQETLDYIRAEMSRRGDFGKVILRFVDKVEAKHKEDLEYESDEDDE